MALLDDVKQGLADAGTTLKADLWKAGDATFLESKAKDLVGLGAKAAAATTPGKKAAYIAAARDVVEHVKLLALIRMEVAEQHALDALGRFFMEKVVPVVIKLLPALIGL